MHVAGADGADLVTPPAKGDEDRSALGSAADGDEAILGSRVSGIRGHAAAMGEGVFDLRMGQAMFQALGAVAVIPVELHEAMYVRLGGRARGRVLPVVLILFWRGHTFANFGFREERRYSLSARPNAEGDAPG